MKAILIAILALSSTLAFADNVVFDLNGQAPGQTVFVASELTHWDATQMQMPEISPGHYQLSISPPWTASFQYKFVVNGNWFADPENSNQTDDGEGGVNSVMNVTFTEDPLLQLQPGVDPWVSSTLTVQDTTGADRQVIVMSPPASFTQSKRVVTIYFNDGTSYLQQGNAAQMIANLSNEADMPTIIGVFVDPRDRNTEYEMNDPYVSFLADTVVPAVEAQFPSVGKTPADRLIVGSSLGGLISTYTALTRSDVFGNGASESGSFWWSNEAILPILTASKSEKVRLYFDVGVYEEEIMLTSNHDAHNLAVQDGFDLYYQEFPSFHEFIGWRNRLSLIFKHFFQ